MLIKGIGINAHPARIDGDVRNLKADLSFFQHTGYDYVEIPVDAIDVIYRGRIEPRRMRLLKGLLAEFELRYTVHAPLALDLRTKDGYERQLELFASSLEFTRDIGAEIFVYHYGRKSEDPELEDRLLDGVLRMADLAQELRVRICVENIEIDVIQNVVEFVREVDREAVGMTLDLGHGYLAATRFGFDFLEEVRTAAPIVRHIHLSDNFGQFEETRLVSYDLYKQIPYRRRLALGRGDLHLPPGWGEVPWAKALKLLPDYQGILTLEYYHHRYIPEAKEILSEVRTTVERLQAESS